MSNRFTQRAASRVRRLAVSAGLGLALAGLSLPSGSVTLGDSPLFTTVTVPGNLLLDLSVEWPTATSPAYPSSVAYSAASTYLGYFDPAKCYQYNYNSTTPASSYFAPTGLASSHVCTSTSSKPLWSGNYMNWATTQTLDAFRWVLTGGYRSVDTSSMTVLTKTYAAGYGTGTTGGPGDTYIPYVIPIKSVTAGASTVYGATPFNWASVNTRLRFLGTRMWITASNAKVSNTDSTTLPASQDATVTAYTNQNGTADSTKVYEVYVNVQVCSTSVGVESNCVLYGTNTYKPQGLMQTYAGKLRYSAFSYLNDGTPTRNGGVMRARMKYIGPTQPVPGSTAVTNSAAEWNGTTGIMVANPDSTDASAAQAFAAAAGWSVPITNSGVMNYLNQFGNQDQNYKIYDNVSELYYAALRYFRHLGNVPSYSALTGAGSSATAAYWLDGFAIIPTWDDPILYSCQKNFILGIGDVNTWYDADLPGSSKVTGNDSPQESQVTADLSANCDGSTSNTCSVTKSTNMVGQLEGYNGSGTLGSVYWESGKADTLYIAGLAYDAHTTDIRSDLTGSQTVDTYWMDVLENQVYAHKNQYWLATKYGGFTLPSGYSPYATSNGTGTLTDAMWRSNTDTLTVGQSGLTFSTDTGSGSSGFTDKRPDNYFPGNRPELMQSGLTATFNKMANSSQDAMSTAFSSAASKVSYSGNASYAAGYSPSSWTGKLTASTISYDSSGNMTATQIWDAQALLDGTSAASRKIVTCCTTSSTVPGLAFTNTALSTSSLIARTYYASFSSVPGVGTQSAANFVSYLRGDRTQELQNTPVAGAYRSRTHVLGDIVNSKANPVSTPSAPYYDTYNPGYSAFKSTWAGRKTVLYVGANDGMMHAFDGSVSGSTMGTELFAYIPSFTYGDSSTTSDRYYATYGLASLGNPSFSHHYFVNATPQAFDLDLSKTSGSGTSTPNWRTLLIGGMGKGGKGYYAIDVTDPSSWTSESVVAGKVLWEFTDPRMGYSFGDPHVVKTAQYGWVVLFASGYNNSDGVGYLFVVNPRTGALLQAIATPSGSTANPINMAELRAFIPDYTDYTADAVYAGDLQGNVWRFDLTATSGSYPSPTLLATLTNAAGAALPVTTKPLLGIDGTTNKRYVMVGTGELLSDSDISNSSLQAFYAIVDGTSSSGGFYKAATMPSGYTLPVTRSELSPVTNLLTGVGSTPSAMGWYYDFGSTGSIGERMVVDGDVAGNLVAFAATTPNGNACNPSGTGRAFVVKFANGASRLIDGGAIVSSLSVSSGSITDIAFQNVGGIVRLVVGDTSGQTQSRQVSEDQPTIKRLSWREISTVQ